MNGSRRWARQLRGVVCIATLLAGVAAASSARAAPPTEAEKAVARRKFAAGEEAYKQRKYREAVDLFLEADRVISDPAFAYNLSETYAAMGDGAKSLRWAREYVKRSPGAPDRADMDARIAKGEAQLKARGLQQITVTSTPPGVALSIDGSPVGTTPWTGELAPGTHLADLHLGGYRDERRPFELGAEHAMDFEVALESLAPDAPPPTPTPAPVPVVPTPTPQPAAAGEGPPLLPIGAATFGVGVALLGASLGLELARAGAEGDARDAATQLDAYDSAQSMDDFQLGARVTLGLGAGLCAVGGVLVIVDLATGGSEPAPAEPAETATRAAFVPRFAAGCDAQGCAALASISLP